MCILNMLFILSFSYSLFQFILSLFSKCIEILCAIWITIFIIIVFKVRVKFLNILIIIWWLIVLIYIFLIILSSCSYSCSFNFIINLLFFILVMIIWWWIYLIFTYFLIIISKILTIFGISFWFSIIFIFYKWIYFNYSSRLCLLILYCIISFLNRCCIFIIYFYSKIRI